MGAIAAIVNKEKQTTANAVLTMLKTLSHRGKVAYGIASAKTQTLANSIEKLDSRNIQANIALGYVFSRILPEDTPQILNTNNIILAFEGRIYPSKHLVPPIELEKLESNPEGSASTILKNCNGAYSFVIVTSDSLIIGRDTLGLEPLYFGKNETLCAFASERKALWKLGLRNVESFPPGNLATVKDDTRLFFRPIKTVKKTALKQQEMESAAKHLQTLLAQSTKDRVSDVEEVAIAFSGGLDSSIVAFLAQKCNIKVRLITVGLENMPEAKCAEDAAKTLDLPIHVKTYSINDVEATLRKVLWLIEEPNAIETSIAIPLYWTAELAAKRGLTVLMAGQGADELFGGYHRYLRTYAEKGAGVLQREMFHDIANCYETNFQRDNQACAFHNVELRLPFADLRVVNFALSLPLSLKIQSPSDELRKRVLRKAAENFGLPTFIANKAKKAVQYATGVDKALRKLAKREDLNPSGYCRKIFHELFPDVKVDD
jgi:asparagine synthase (glutamine-hydrolysing)